MIDGPIQSVIDENRRRHGLIARGHYDPLLGNPSDPDRVEVARGIDRLYLPKTMLSDEGYSVALPAHDFDMLRFRHDFEYWAARCVKICHKTTKQLVPFVLNRPQRRLLRVMEERRRAGLPVRIILLKARQWGASTLVQIYFAWIQMIHLRNWHSLICAHVKDAASTIRGMYTCLLENYPQEYWEEECQIGFKPFERMTNVRVIPGRGCKIAVCSSENQESTRSMDCSMAHLSEVAFWKDSELHNPVDLMRSVVSGIARSPMTVVVMESTANGVGNFFHKEWMRAVDGESDKIPFFVGWHEIDIYSEPLEEDRVEEFFESMTEYERWLWTDCGCTLEAILWYRNKAREYTEHRSMMAEFPTTASEAFCATESSVFYEADVARLRADGCGSPAETGEVLGSRGGVPSDLSRPWFQPSPCGLTKVWCRPRTGAEYIVSVDIGGRSRSADYSVITVLDRHTDSESTCHTAPESPCHTDKEAEGRPEVVAQWRGHIDHDLLAWKAAAMATWYNGALLVVESNTWEGGSEGHGRYILETLADSYPNMYYRDTECHVTQGGSRVVRKLPGFHTNMRTKASLIANLIALVRDGGYIEHDHEACNELMQYEALADGSYAARRGCHDDILMSRAIALWVHSSLTRHTGYVITAADRLALLSQ